MPHSLPSFHVMPVDWQHNAWQGRFYPDDLPEDWRLGYFANEFSEVLLPQAAWVETGLDQLQAWVDDVGENFRFFLLISDAVESCSCAQRFEVFGDNLGGFVFLQNIAEPDRRDALVAASRLRGVEVFEALEACIRNPLPAIPQARGMELALVFTDQDLGDLRVQRSFFEQLQTSVQPNDLVLLCFAGDPPPIESIQKLQEVAGLMGLA